MLKTRRKKNSWCYSKRESTLVTISKCIIFTIKFFRWTTQVMKLRNKHTVVIYQTIMRFHKLLTTFSNVLIPFSSFNKIRRALNFKRRFLYAKLRVNCLSLDRPSRWLSQQILCTYLRATVSLLFALWYKYLFNKTFATVLSSSLLGRKCFVILILPQ